MCSNNIHGKFLSQKNKDLYSIFTVKDLFIFKRGGIMARRRKRENKKAERLSEDKMGLYMLGVVGIVAAVGLFVVLMNAGLVSTDVTGAAVSTAPTYSDWTTCLDQGNQVKLANREDGYLVKKNTCTGSAITGKQIKVVSCAQDVDGSYTYKYANAEDCPTDTKCMKDKVGSAYCG